jgi:hypothetical protein
MMLEICVGLIVIASIIIILYLLTRSSGPISIDRTTQNGNVCLKVKANRGIKSIEVKSGNGEEGLLFVRKNLSKDDSVEFLLPPNPGKLELLITYEGGTKSVSI